MDNLKPCPFCGKEAEPIQEPPMQHRAYIICSDHNCWGHMKVEWGTMDDKDKFIKRLIENWNRRPDLWIPITERLPESGKHVLLCCEVRPAMKRYICDGYYAKAKSIINSCSFDYECAVEYDEEQDEYFLLEGFYEVIKNWDEYSSISIGDFVTHWMPLPEPPKEVR